MPPIAGCNTGTRLATEQHKDTPRQLATADAYGS